jgi:serine/threonine-protein kinase
LDRDTTVTTVTEVQAGRGPARNTVLLGKYRVESTLGFGGMGLVIKAKNLALDEDVAIKVLREDIQIDGDNVTRFVREAKNAVKLKSEHVARIRDVGTFEDGRPYMVMELLEGLDLGKMLLDQGSIDRQRAVDLLLQACDAIAEAHSLGIVHRDLKPTNLFVAKRRDGSDLLKVLDFGISKAKLGPDMSLTQTQSMLGTPAYMSPEQMRSARTVDPRSDIWSLGCVLYELVEGRPPFEASNFAELCVMVSIEAFTPMTAAPELTPIMERVLAKNADDRFQDVADLAYALELYGSDPERAHRQVARMFRVLGRQHPEGRDSTPMPLSRGSQSRISSSDIPQRPALPRTPTPTVALRSSGIWKSVLFLAVLFGIGIAAGLLVMSGDDDKKPAPAPSAGSTSDESTAAGSSVPAEDVTIPRDAAVEAVTPVDAALETTAPPAGSATPVPVVAKPKIPAHKPQPPRKPAKPPVRPPASTTTTTTAPPHASPPPAPPPPPPAPPKPKCDPFDNPKGCK